MALAMVVALVIMFIIKLRFPSHEVDLAEVAPIRFLTFLNMLAVSILGKSHLFVFFFIRFYLDGKGSRLDNGKLFAGRAVSRSFLSV